MTSLNEEPLEIFRQFGAGQVARLPRDIDFHRRVRDFDQQVIDRALDSFQCRCNGSQRRTGFACKFKRDAATLTDADGRVVAAGMEVFVDSHGSIARIARSCGVTRRPRRMRG